MIYTQTVLEDMARFFLKELFYNIPYIPVTYSSDIEGSMGQFGLKEADDYDPDEDELMQAYEYRWTYKPLWDELGGVDIGTDVSWMDPLNHPTAKIQINRNLKKDLRKLTSVLIHELLHYYLWYIGWEYHDNSKDFLDKCKEMELPTNYTDWVYKDGRWVDMYDYKKADKYIQMYFNGEFEKFMAA